MACKSALLLGVLVSVLLVCLDVVYAQELTETNGFGRNIGNGGRFTRGIGQLGYIGGQGRGPQNIYGRGFGSRYGGRNGFPGYLGGRGSGFGGYGARYGNGQGFGRNRFRVGPFGGGYNGGGGYNFGQN